MNLEPIRESNFVNSITVFPSPPEQDGDVVIMASTFVLLSRMENVLGAIVETHSETTLTDQFKMGILQKQVIARNIDPHTLIHKAILENSPEVIRFLLAQGVSVDYPDENGMSPLTIAILNRCNYAVEVLLAYGANTNPRLKWNGMSLLELALNMTDANTAMSLVRHGADVNGRLKDGRNLLDKVISLVHINHQFSNLAKEMICRGADIHANELSGGCPVETAIFYDKSILELMIRKGLNPNIVMMQNGREFRTPLIYAISTGKLDVVKVLVESGADVNKTINWGNKIRSPLNEALERGSPAIVQYLLQHGAKR